MRVSVGNRGRSSLGRRVALFMTGLMVLSVLGTGSALAAKPNLVVTGNAIPGTANDTGTTAQPTMVSTNDTVQFTTSIYNHDTSNVSQLYFSALSTPAGATVSAITASREGCSTTTTPLCSFGALRPEESVRVTIIFTTPAVADSSITSCPLGSNAYLGTLTTLTGSPPYFCVDLRWSANGFPEGGNNSHGDYFDWFDGAALNGDAVNFHGRFVYVNGQQQIVANSLNVGNGNRQGTQASVNDLDIPVTVLDGPNVPKICTTGLINLFGGAHSGETFDCSTLTSETSDVNVDNSNIVNTFGLLVKFYQAPSGLKGNNPRALHQYTTPAGAIITEVITNQCTFVAGVPTNIPCLVVGNGAKQVTIWNDHNGKYNF
jgi:hypothetical protein